MDKPYDRLRAARVHAGFQTAQQACERFHWNPGTYRSHERSPDQAGARDFSPKWAETYAGAFRVPADWLLWGKNPPSWLNSEPFAQDFEGRETGSASAAPNIFDEDAVNIEMLVKTAVLYLRGAIATKMEMTIEQSHLMFQEDLSSPFAALSLAKALRLVTDPEVMDLAHLFEIGKMAETLKADFSFTHPDVQPFVSSLSVFDGAGRKVGQRDALHGVVLAYGRAIAALSKSWDVTASVGNRAKVTREA